MNPSKCYTIDSVLTEHAETVQKHSITYLSEQTSSCGCLSLTVLEYSLGYRIGVRTLRVELRSFSDVIVNDQGKYLHNCLCRRRKLVSRRCPPSWRVYLNYLRCRKNCEGFASNYVFDPFQTYSSRSGRVLLRKAESNW